MTQLNPKYRDVLATLGAPEDPVATDTSSEWSAMSLLKAIYGSVSVLITGNTGATDNAILRANGTGGAKLKNSSITITDSGVLTLATSGNAIKTSGAPGYSGIWHWGGDVAANFWIDSTFTAASATVPEFGAQFGITSSVGSGAAATAYKVALASYAIANSGSANAYGANVVADAETGFSKLLAGLEIDINQNRGAHETYANLGGASVTQGMALVSGGTYDIAAGVWLFSASGTGKFATGIAASPGSISIANASNALIWDGSSSPYVMRVTGSHDFVIGATGATLSYLAVGPNNTTLLASANAAGAALVAGLKLNASNIWEIGQSGYPVLCNDAFSVGTIQKITSGTLELGHLSDTTLSRASAGQLAVEGINVLMNGGALGTPSSGTLTNCTGLPISTGVSGLGSNVAAMLATFSSANIAAACTDETGSGALVFATAPTFTTNITAPLVIGGTAAAASLELRATSGVGAGSELVKISAGNNGGTTIGTFQTAGITLYTALTLLGQYNVQTGTQYTGFNVKKGDGTVIATLIGLTAANDGGDFSLYNGGVQQIRLSANAGVPSYVNGGSGFAVGSTADPGVGAISATAAIKSSGPTSGIGYATGAGGAVTQATSRTTAVTLNTICGAITLVSAAGSTSFQTFTVNNSAVAATDLPKVVQKSGTDKYAIWVSRVAAGAFDITFATLSGTTTEQPVFNFLVEKAVTS